MATFAQRIAADGIDPDHVEPTVRRRIARRRPVTPARIAERLFGPSTFATWFVAAVLLLLGLLLVRPLVMSTLSWHRTAGLLADRRSEVAGLRARHDALRLQLTYFNTDAFLAERAREYGLVRAGETPFVIREFTRGESPARFSLDQLPTHVGDFPSAPKISAKQEAKIIAAENAGTVTPDTAAPSTTAPTSTTTSLTPSD